MITELAFFSFGSTSAVLDVIEIDDLEPIYRVSVKQGPNDRTSYFSDGDEALAYYGSML